MIGNPEYALRWDASLDIGIPELDEQHAALMEKARAVTHAITAAMEPLALARLLVDLVASAERHFASEERMMEERGYPECHIHLEQHRELLAQLRRFSESDAFSRSPSDGLKAVRFVAEWLTRHIRNSDRRFAAHCLAPDNGITNASPADSRNR